MEHRQGIIVAVVLVGIAASVGGCFLWKRTERLVAQVPAPSIVVQPAPVVVQTIPAPQVNVIVQPAPPPAPPPPPAVVEPPPVVEPPVAQPPAVAQPPVVPAPRRHKHKQRRYPQPQCDW